MADLHPERIAAAGLEVANKHGVEGFTMRAVADSLGVTPMALYHHVKDKAALAALIIDTAIRKDPLPPATGNWREDLWTMAERIRLGMKAYPVIAQLRRAYNVWTPSMLRIPERWLSYWQQSGLNPSDAVLASTTSSIAVMGLVQEEMMLVSMKYPDESMLAWLPNVRTIFQGHHDRDAEFELVVRSLIDGLHARLSIARTESARRGEKNARPSRRRTGK